MVLVPAEKTTESRGKSEAFVAAFKDAMQTAGPQALADAFEPAARQMLELFNSGEQLPEYQLTAPAAVAGGGAEIAPAAAAAAATGDPIEGAGSAVAALDQLLFQFVILLNDRLIMEEELARMVLRRVSAVMGDEGAGAMRHKLALQLLRIFPVVWWPNTHRQCKALLLGQHNEGAGMRTQQEQEEGKQQQQGQDAEQMQLCRDPQQAQAAPAQAGSGQVLMGYETPQQLMALGVQGHQQHQQQQQQLGCSSSLLLQADQGASVHVQLDMLTPELQQQQLAQEGITNPCNPPAAAATAAAGGSGAGPSAAVAAASGAAAVGGGNGGGGGGGGAGGDGGGGGGAAAAAAPGAVLAAADRVLKVLAEATGMSLVYNFLKDAGARCHQQQENAAELEDAAQATKLEGLVRQARMKQQQQLTQLLQGAGSRGLGQQQQQQQQGRQEEVVEVLIKTITTSLEELLVGVGKQEELAQLVRDAARVELDAQLVECSAGRGFVSILKHPADNLLVGNTCPCLVFLARMCCHLNIWSCPYAASR